MHYSTSLKLLTPQGCSCDSILFCRTPQQPIVIDSENEPEVVSISDSPKNSDHSDHGPSPRDHSDHGLSPRSPHSFEDLIYIFQNLTKNQVEAVYHASGGDVDASNVCLSTGPTIGSILIMLKAVFDRALVIKTEVDSDELWKDMVVLYKSPRIDVTKRLRIRLENQPPLDTGGVRCMVYSSIYSDFINNKFVKMFDGPSHSCRPRCTADTRSSGLFKVLGTMVAHSISQDGVGFPYLSPTIYWYLVDGDEKAMEFASMEDVGADVASVICKVG